MPVSGSNLPIGEIMGNCFYKDSYIGHQAQGASDEDIPVLPPGLDTDIFTDAQLLYLADWWNDSRLALVNKLLAFLLKSRLKARLVLLDKMLNHPDMPWSETAAAYGISQHVLYNVKHQVEKELAESNPRTVALLFPRGHAARPRCSRGNASE